LSQRPAPFPCRLCTVPIEDGFSGCLPIPSLAPFRRFNRWAKVDSGTPVGVWGFFINGIHPILVFGCFSSVGGLRREIWYYRALFFLQVLRCAFFAPSRLHIPSPFRFEKLLDHCHPSFQKSGRASSACPPSLN